MKTGGHFAKDEWDIPEIKHLQTQMKSFSVATLKIFFLTDRFQYAMMYNNIKKEIPARPAETVKILTFVTSFIFTPKRL